MRKSWHFFSDICILRWNAHVLSFSHYTKRFVPLFDRVDFAEYKQSYYLLIIIWTHNSCQRSHPNVETRNIYAYIVKRSLSGGASLLILATIHSSQSYLLENGAKPCTQSTPTHRYMNTLGGPWVITSWNVCFSFQETAKLEKRWVFNLPWHYLSAPHRVRQNVPFNIAITQ